MTRKQTSAHIRRLKRRAKGIQCFEWSFTGYSFNTWTGYQKWSGRT